MFGGEQGNFEEKGRSGDHGHNALYFGGAREYVRRERFIDLITSGSEA